MDPVIKEVTVPLNPDRAFQLFTQEMADWWPLDQHSLSAMTGETAADITVPDEVGAQVIETKPDGSKTPWGRVTEYKPGRAFGMNWHVGRPEEYASHVRVTFEVVADGTRVLLVHDNWQALGSKASAIRAQYQSGWDFVLIDCFAARTKMRLAAE